MPFILSALCHRLLIFAGDILTPLHLYPRAFFRVFVVVLEKNLGYCPMTRWGAIPNKKENLNEGGKFLNGKA
jgi:hypothetical protein